MTRKIGDNMPAYFMIHAPSSGTTHAINPKTKRTWCGRDPVAEEWRPTDKIPSQRDEPTCMICQRRWKEPLQEEMQLIADALEESIGEYLDTRIILLDVDGLGRFVTAIKKFMHEERKRAEKAKESKDKGNRENEQKIFTQNHFSE